MTADLPGAVLASIPSPAEGVWHLGPLPVRAYALAILLGIVVAIWLGERRWVARGGRRGTVSDVAVWAVPFGIVGGRIYHVLTDWGSYFGAGADPVRALQIWRGGLGIWGAITLGGVGAWIACRRKGIALPPMADALAPGIALAQAVGRFGNYFNQELFGRPTDLPWGLEIDPEHRPAGYEDIATFHPTFLYEALWLVGVALVVIWGDRRFRMGHGRAFALYVALYTLGRGWIEALRIDPSNDILGLRLNVWTSVLVFIGAVAYIVVSLRVRPGREDEMEPGQPADPAAQAADGGAAAGASTKEPAVEAADEGAPEPADDEPESADDEPESADDEPEPADDEPEPADKEPAADASAKEPG